VTRTSSAAAGWLGRCALEARDTTLKDVRPAADALGRASAAARRPREIGRPGGRSRNYGEDRQVGRVRAQPLQRAPPFGTGKVLARDEADVRARIEKAGLVEPGSGQMRLHDGERLADLPGGLERLRPHDQRRGRPEAHLVVEDHAALELHPCSAR
jgi:hypothetical protein